MMVWPSSALAKPLGNGKAQILAVERDLVDARALELGREAAADGFDFGQFRHGRPSTMRG